MIRKILIVDDEEEIVRGLAVRLRAAGYETSAACNGAEALRSLAQTRPDAILLDVRMPDIDGLTVLRLLQKDAGTRRIPVVMLSASLSDQRHALHAGARFFLAKPYKGGELLQVVQQVTAAPNLREAAEPIAAVEAN